MWPDCARLGYRPVKLLDAPLNGPQRILELIMEDRWLSVDEIGDYLGIKRDTIYKWISEKGMPAHKIGRLWKFKKDEVDMWVREGRAGETNERK